MASPLCAWGPQQFHQAAYLADDRQDLLQAINEFLDCSVVLPPSEVQGDELLRSVAHFQREMLRRREEQERRLLAGTALEPKSPEEKGRPGHTPPPPCRGPSLRLRARGRGAAVHPQSVPPTRFRPAFKHIVKVG